MFTTELQAGLIEATGTVDFDDIGNTIITVAVAGEVLTETELTPKEFEVLKRFFAKEYS
jgi:hypothetical protein